MAHAHTCCSGWKKTSSSVLSLVHCYPLRSADAIQLATAVTLHDSFQAARFGPITVASADDRVLQAASQEGLPVENPTLQ
jgi:hypothetical protein